MAKVTVLKVEDNGTVKALPTEFNNDREAHASIKESGRYIFLQSEDITVKVKAESKPKAATKKK